MKAIHAGACGLFGTVLGPEANDAHRNHLHLDLKPRAHKAYCR
ncbi:MAG: extensin family protein [Proteobacteria bacterium]|nr:extensin family protein [Pseudomonadota bacterium]